MAYQLNLTLLKSRAQKLLWESCPAEFAPIVLDRAVSYGHTWLESSGEWDCRWVKEIMKGDWVLDYRQPTVSAVAINICFLNFLFIYLFLAVQGLHCCMGFSLVSEWGILSRCGVWASYCACCWNTGLVAPWHVDLPRCEIFQDQEFNPVPYIGRQILCHWATREVCC